MKPEQDCCNWIAGKCAGVTWNLTKSGFIHQYEFRKSGLKCEPKDCKHFRRCCQPAVIPHTRPARRTQMAQERRFL